MHRGVRPTEDDLPVVKPRGSKVATSAERSANANSGFLNCLAQLCEAIFHLACFWGRASLGPGGAGPSPRRTDFGCSALPLRPLPGPSPAALDLSGPYHHHHLLLSP